MTPGNPSATLDEVYFDRNQAALAFAKVCRVLGMKVWVSVRPEEPDWPIVYVELPNFGQVSWHVRDEDIMRGDWPRDLGKWDGHSTEVKRIRLANFLLLRDRL